MYILEKKDVNVERARQLIVLLTYMTSPTLMISKKDINLIETYIDKIIKIYERNCIDYEN